MPAKTGEAQHYELRFRSLHNEGQGLSFPCDERGEVPLDQLSERAVMNYLYARACIGIEYAYPAIMLSDHLH